MHGDLFGLEWVTVKTTLPKLPLPPNSQREHVRTERLLIRPLVAEDIDDFRVLRSQPEVMRRSIQGVPDADLEATRQNLSLRLPPRDTERYDFAICVAETGQFIGVGGMGMLKGELGWPTIGYMFRREAWGQGYATEFLRGFLDIWWALPRDEVELQVDKDAVWGDGEVKEELVLAAIVDNNLASQHVAEKCGFARVKVFEAEDHNVESGMVTLYGFVAKRPESKP